MRRAKRKEEPHSGGRLLPGGRESLGQVLDFMQLLWAVNHGLTSVSKRMRQHLGITGPQRLVIRLVGQEPGISAGELAQRLHVHPSTVTGILSRLSEKGAIERKNDPGDARRAVLRLTRKGRELNELRSGTAESLVRSALLALSRDDLAAAARVLGRIASELSEA
jgi:DNA-binding MarR family transcriptional regulator